MNSSIDEFEEQIMRDIENKQYLKASHSLTYIIQSLNANTIEMSLNNNLYKYYLMRSHCYQQISTDESLALAFHDFLAAIQLTQNRFECYLQGAFVYLDQNKFDNAFQLFEKSIQLKPELRDQLTNELNFVKFKALRDRGINEEASFIYALNYETIGECIEAINFDDYKKPNIIKFICGRLHDKGNESVLNNICNNITNSLRFNDNNSNNCIINGNDENELFAFRKRSFSQVVSEAKDQFKTIDNYNLWKPTANDFCSGNQLIGKTAICRPNSALNSDETNCKSSVDSNQQQMSSVEEWINNESNYENISKLCSFEKPQKLSDDSDNTIAGEQSKGSNNSSKLSEVKRTPTNLHKLRGVYIGNLKKSFDHKVLKNYFKAYGTIVDFYQPSGAGYAFIHFNSHESATNMIADWQSIRINECRDNTKLHLRFIPTQDQMQKYNSLTYSQYRKKVIEYEECDYWRSGSKCKYGKECFYKHIPINKSIDTLPDKRKSNWKL